MKALCRSQAANAWFIFALLCLAYLFIPFHRVCPAVMAPDLTRDIGLEAAALGGLASVYFFTYGFFQIPAGIFADRYGPRAILPLFLGITAAGSLLFACADSAPLLMLGRAAIGCGTSALFMASLKIFGTWFPPACYARMNGIYLGMGGVGIICASGALAAACQLWGWRLVMQCSAVLALLLAAASWLWIFDTPRQAGLPTASPVPPRAAGGAAATPTAASTTQMPLPLGTALRRVMGGRYFWCATLWICGAFILHMGFGGLWGGPFLMDRYGLSQTDAGTVLNMMGVGMLLGGPINGWLSDAVFNARRPVMLLNSAVLILLFTLLAACRLPLWGLYIWFCLLSMSGVGSACVVFAALRDRYGTALSGTASGLLNSIPSMLMLLIQPFSGWLLATQGRIDGEFTAQGYTLLFFCYMALGALALLGAYLLPERSAKEG